MIKKSIKIGAYVNLLFFIFHIYLGWLILNLDKISPEHKILMFMLNTGGILFIGFFAVTSFRYGDELINTRTGTAVLYLILATYLVRAVEEIIFFGSRMSPLIFTSCVLVSSLYLFIIVKTAASQSQP